jgi:hypothetical protein
MPCSKEASKTTTPRTDVDIVLDGLAARRHGDVVGEEVDAGTGEPGGRVVVVSLVDAPVQADQRHAAGEAEEADGRVSVVVQHDRLRRVGQARPGRHLDRVDDGRQGRDFDGAGAALRGERDLDRATLPGRDADPIPARLIEDRVSAGGRARVDEPPLSPGVLQHHDEIRLAALGHGEARRIDQAEGAAERLQAHPVDRSRLQIDLGVSFADLGAHGRHLVVDADRDDVVSLRVDLAATGHVDTQGSIHPLADNQQLDESALRDGPRGRDGLFRVERIRKLVGEASGDLEGEGRRRALVADHRPRTRAPVPTPVAEQVELVFAPGQTRRQPHEKQRARHAGMPCIPRALCPCAISIESAAPPPRRVAKTGRTGASSRTRLDAAISESRAWPGHVAEDGRRVGERGRAAQGGRRARGALQARPGGGRRRARAGEADGAEHGAVRVLH